MDGIGISRRASCERRIKPPPRRLRTSSRFQNDNLTRRRQRIHAPKPRYAMTENRVVALRQKGAIDDPLTEILRTGARRLIAQAVEAEFEAFLGSTAELVLPDGRRRVVRHGHDPVRAIQTGIGPIEVQKPKARDRAASGERIRFTSNILPKWARRTKSLDALLPVLYLRGISAGDFQE